MEQDRKRVAVLELTSEAEVRDIDNLESMVDGRWQYESEINVGSGKIEIYRVES